MAGGGDRLSELKAARDAARKRLTERVGRLKSDAAPGGIAKRAMDDIAYRSSIGARHLIEIANDNRGIVAGTVTALALWLAREPLGLALSALGDRMQKRVPLLRRLLPKRDTTDSGPDTDEKEQNP